MYVMESDSNTKPYRKGKIVVLVGIITCFLVATAVGLILHYLKKVPSPDVTHKTVRHGVIIGCGKDDVDRDHCSTIGYVYSIV